MREPSLFLSLWVVVGVGGALAIATLGPFGRSVVAFALLYGAMATGWSWLRSTGLLSFGHAAFFGTGALAQAFLVSAGNTPPGLALAASAVAGAVAALPLLPALRLGTASFALATLSYAVLLRGLAANIPSFGMEGFLLPAAAGLVGAAPRLLAALAALAFGLTAGYASFLRRTSGRAAGALRQDPETSVSLGIDAVGARWFPLTVSASATAVAGALYAHLVGSVEASVAFSPEFSALPLVMGLAGGALHPLGGMLGMLALYPVDELLLRPLLPQAHPLLYGLALVCLILFRPRGLLGSPGPETPRPSILRRGPPRASTLTVQGLTVRRNGAVVLRDVSFVVEPGEILRVLGPNGAGKTSLLLAIAGRIPVAGGAVLFADSRAPGGAAARARRGLARTFQTPRPFPEWTVRENVALAAERSGAPGREEAILGELHLTEFRDRRADQLSVGEGKRLELARALAFNPAILLLDEPLAGLSPDAARDLSRRIERASRDGAAVVWVEHGPVRARPESRVLVLEGGRTRFLGPGSGREAARREPPP
jgi:ABC-type branched-subunit amino acid transport system ATPase component/ABC-type branched-subunit amino acid transport system permease subunit